MGKELNEKHSCLFKDTTTFLLCFPKASSITVCSVEGVAFSKVKLSGSVCDEEQDISSAVALA